MIAVFFAKSGRLASVPLQARKTVNAEWYINTCLPKVFEAWSARRPNTGTRGLLLYLTTVHQHLPAQGLRGLERTPAACCTTTTTRVPTPPPPLWTTWEKILFSWYPTPIFTGLCPLLLSVPSSEATVQQFQCVEDAQAFFQGVISDISQSTWSDIMVVWAERMTKCA